MLVSIALTAAIVMHGACLHKTSRRDAMARDPRRNPPAETEICCSKAETRPRRWGFCPRRDRDETLVRLETVSRPRRLDRDHIPAQ